MIYHLSASWLPGGLVGVDIYFAISGFVVSTSLGVEEQFYLVFPFLFFAWVALNDRKRGRILATALLASLGLASFIACVYATQNTPAAAFYSIFCRFWELAVGVLLYQLTAHSQAPASGANSLLAAALPWLGAVVIIVTFVYASATAFPWFWAVPPVLGVACIIGGDRIDVTHPLRRMGRNARHLLATESAQPQCIFAQCR